MLFLRGGCQIEFVWGPSWRSWFSAEAGKIHGTSMQCVASLVWIGTGLDLKQTYQDMSRAFPKSFAAKA